MAKLPKQLYITAKPQNTYNNGIVVAVGVPLGFLNAYEPGKSAFEKKRITQEEWAYRDYINDFKLEKHGNEVWVTGWKWARWDPANPNQRNKEQIAEPVNPQPQVWDNDALPGFKIEKSVSRYSTSNKLWRVLDPRGVEFEITTGVLEQIIEDATILKGGIIDANCAWMANKNLVVIS